jgi:hypothetical protein
VNKAEKHLSLLAAIDFTYKDVSALLDKLTEMRKNRPSEGGSPTPEPPP